jgi:hypothetical protein
LFGLYFVWFVARAVHVDKGRILQKVGLGRTCIVL